MSAALASRSRTRTRLIVGLLVLAGLIVLGGANAHLLYVAVMSQPGCVDHVRPGEARDGMFGAAKSACSPGARS